MTESTTPQSPRRYKAPDSPLQPSQLRQQPSDSAPLSPSAGFAVQDDYGSDEDLAISLARPTIMSSSPRRESSSAALLGDSFETPPSPRTRQRQTRLRDGYLGNESTEWGPLAALKCFIDRNSGELFCLFLSKLAVGSLNLLSHSSIAPGLLCIALAQLFFAIMYLCVKILLLEVEAVPIWELIIIRMGTTAFFCILWLKYSGDPNPILGPPGVRGLLFIRAIMGFFGQFSFSTLLYPLFILIRVHAR
jgi:hypothetical protein